MLLHIVFPFFFLFHPFYVSYTDAKYNSKEQKVECVTKLFPDDFERALQKYTGNSTFQLRQDSQTCSLAASYFNSRCFCSSGKKNIVLKAVGCELDAEAFWFYYDLPVGNPEFIWNLSILTEIEPTQQNIVTFYTPHGKKTEKFTRDDFSRKILFE
jgi:hypothetical protein